MRASQLMRYKKSYPFSNRLNEFIFDFLEKEGIKYTVVDEDIPESEVLNQDPKNLKIWSGGSENTIFGNPETNYAFRAWHDYIHITKQLDFSPLNEARVAFIQAAILPEEWLFERYLILIEVIGQVLHHDAWGEFVPDQRLFTCQMMYLGFSTKQT